MSLLDSGFKTARPGRFDAARTARVPHLSGLVLERCGVRVKSMRDPGGCRKRPEAPSPKERNGSYSLAGGPDVSPEDGFGCPSIRAKALSRDSSPQQCSQHRVAATEVRTKALEMARRIISR